MIILPHSTYFRTPPPDAIRGQLPMVPPSFTQTLTLDRLWHLYHSIFSPVTKETNTVSKTTGKR
jgi:hypothetical protein